MAPFPKKSLRVIVFNKRVFMFYNQLRPKYNFFFVWYIKAKSTFIGVYIKLTGFFKLVTDLC